MLASARAVTPLQPQPGGEPGTQAVEVAFASQVAAWFSCDMACSRQLSNHREERLCRFNAAVKMVPSLPFEVDLRRVQNVFYQLLQQFYPAVAMDGDEASQRWIVEFSALGGKLGVCVEPVAAPSAQAPELAK